MGQKNGPFAQTNIFWEKIIILFSSTYWPLSLNNIFKKLLQWIQSYEDAPFLGPKWSISPNEIFFFFSENLLIRLASFIHAYLRVKKQSQILIYSWNIDDYRIVKPHWLRAIFGYNLRTRIFPNMQFLQNVSEP